MNRIINILSLADINIDIAIQLTDTLQQMANTIPITEYFMMRFIFKNV